MKHLKKVLIFGIFLCGAFTQAQSTNIFLDRDFWKTNPSITVINNKITQGNDISALNKYAFDGVVYAILEKTDNATIQYLISKDGNSVNKRTHDARTYIFWAAYKDNIKLMQFLVDSGADTKLIDSHGNSVTTFAATTGQVNTKLYDFLIANGANLETEKNPKGANALLLASSHVKNFDLIEYFISKGIAINTKDIDGNGVFNYATKGGNIDLLKTLVKKGVDYKSLNNNGGNAFISASQGKRGGKLSLDTFTYLESIGINPNITNNTGKTPLHAIAYSTKNTKIYDYFLSKGVNINQADSEGNTAFTNAIGRNDIATISYLSEHVKDINLRNSDGKSALTMAVSQNTAEVVDFLLQKNADANVKDTKGNNLSYYLAQIYNAKKADNFDKKLALLSKKGFDFNAPQANGNTLFHLAADKNDIALMKLITSKKMNVNAKNKEGNTALHIAAMKSENDAILKYLLEKGADKNAKTEFKESAFDLANENELLKNNKIALNFLK